MRWKGREQSQNVEDRRGVSPGMIAGGGGLTLLIVVGIAMLLGADPRQVQQLFQQAQTQRAQPTQRTQAPNDDTREFISVILRDNETIWKKIFAEDLRARFLDPKLVIYEQRVMTQGCGPASSEVGPFYCPADKTIYIDPEFFAQLAERHRAPGDFAQAYVIAHEFAHHVQNLTGFMEKVDQVRQRGSKLDANKASVRLELQADYLAGVWAHHAHQEYQTLEEGDLEEGIVAANQIGDDVLMRESGMAVDHRRFTHGSSKQRVYWFAKGLKSGDFAGCRELFEADEEMLDPRNRSE